MGMIAGGSRTVLRAAAFVVAVVIASVIMGALPFIGTPTTLQGYWASGFASSIAQTGWFTVHAPHVGAPGPAAIAFGLSETVVQAVFIRLGVPAADSYSLTTMLFLALALWGGLRFMQ